MVFVVEFKGSSYKVPTCAVRKSEGSVQNPKIQSQRLTRLKKAIRTYAEEAGKPLTSQEVAEVIELARDKIPAGYLPDARKPMEPIAEVVEGIQKMEVTESGDANVKIIKPLRKAAEKSCLHAQEVDCANDVQKFPLGSSRKCLCA